MSCVNRLAARRRCETCPSAHYRPIHCCRQCEMRWEALMPSLHTRQGRGGRWPGLAAAQPCQRCDEVDCVTGFAVTVGRRSVDALPSLETSTIVEVRGPRVAGMPSTLERSFNWPRIPRRSRASQLWFQTIGLQTRGHPIHCQPLSARRGGADSSPGSRLTMRCSRHTKTPVQALTRLSGRCPLKSPAGTLPWLPSVEPNQALRSSPALRDPAPSWCVRCLRAMDVKGLPRSPCLRFSGPWPAVLQGRAQRWRFHPGT